MNMSIEITRFNFPTQILYGAGALRELPKELSSLGSARPMIVTDSFLAKTVLITSLQALLETEEIDYLLYTEIQPNPYDSDIVRGSKLFRTSGCDCVIGVGGGSPMDSAKSIALLAGQGGVVSDYDAQAPGKREITGPLPPIVMIPTTAGTGSEVGKCAVVTSTALHRKIFLCSPLMMPARAILDPMLTVSLPPKLTAATGMDALTHAIESLTCPMFHPMCDAIAIKGIELAAGYLEKAFHEPDHIEARGAMMLSAMMGAVAFQKDLGAAHSLSHALSAVSGLQHGLANAIVLPSVMRFNLDYCLDEYGEISRIFGVSRASLTRKEAAAAAIKEIEKLSRRIGIPESLVDAGVAADSLDETAEKAFLDPCHLTNARPCTKEDLRALLEESFRSF